MLRIDGSLGAQPMADRSDELERMLARTEDGGAPRRSRET